MKHIFLLITAFIFCTGINAQNMFFIKNLDGTNAESTNPQSFFQCNGKTVFEARPNSSSKTSLWVTDGTPSGTSLLNNTLPNNFYSPAVFYSFEMGSKSYFFTSNPYQLWVTDATPAGTKMVYDFGIQYAGVFNFSIGFIGTDFYFNGYDNVAGWELFKSDGTAAGTAMVRNIYASSGKNSSPSNFVTYKGELYFFAQDATNFFNLWKTDGTFAGTKIAFNLSANFEPPAAYPFISSIVYNNLLYFIAAPDSINHGGFPNALWKTDGTSFSKVFSNSEYTSLIGSTGPIKLNVYDGKLIISASAGMYATDGTAANTKFFLIGTDFPTIYHGKAYFLYNDGTHGNEVWVSDFTQAGTKMFKDMNTHAIASQPGNGNPLFFTVYNDKLYFTAEEYDPVDGRIRNLWVTEGDTTTLTKIIPSFTANSNPSPAELRICNNSIYFNAAYTSQDFELYRFGPDIFPASVNTQKNNVFEVYPNPAKGSFSVKLGENVDNIASFYICDMLGKVVETKGIINRDKIDFDMEGQPAGTYIVKAVTNENVYTQKVILTR